MKNYKLIVLFPIFVLLPQIALAGGVDWKAQIINLEIEDDAYVVILKPLEKSQRFMCNEFVIKGRYEGTSFFGIYLSPTLKHNHDLALLALSYKYKQGKPAHVLSSGNVAYGPVCEFSSATIGINEKYPDIIQFYDSSDQITHSF